MRPSVPWIGGFANNRGAPGSVVITSAIGTGLETIREIRFSGSGVLAQILSPPRADRIDVAISIAADAFPGPRAVVLPGIQSDPTENGRLPALFYVLARSSYGGMIGIGGQLI